MNRTMLVGTMVGSVALFVTPIGVEAQEEDCYICGDDVLNERHRLDEPDDTLSSDDALPEDGFTLAGGWSVPGIVGEDACVQSGPNYCEDFHNEISSTGFVSVGFGGGGEDVLWTGPGPHGYEDGNCMSEPHNHEPGCGGTGGGEHEEDIELAKAMIDGTHPVTAEDLRSLLTGDPDGSFVLNTERIALQVRDCHRHVVAHIPLSPDLMAFVADLKP